LADRYPAAPSLQQIFDRLFATYGPQHWWPGDSPFEVIVGAVLTQNAAWINVERAIGNLKQAGRLSLHGLLALGEPELAELIRPSGYFNVKAKRLHRLCVFLAQRGGIEGLQILETRALRHDLLAVHGVGPETADDILLYAFARPVFVIDAYTRRLFGRLGRLSGTETYEQLRAMFEAELPAEVELFNEYHALIVRHAKQVCGGKPRCAGCCLRAHCPFGLAEVRD
jgi:endonuclease-3 related protein